MPYKITFCFPEYPNSILVAYVSGRNEIEAISNFKDGYPHLSECKILKIVNNDT